jgi:molybdenum cofactor cytidylyltransferase
MGVRCASATAPYMPEAGQPFRLGAVILAAGGSSRMGQAKQLLEIGGKTLIARAVDAALDSGARPVAVVVGADPGRVLARLKDRGIIAVHNPDWATGLSSSIRAGLAALLAAEPSLDAVLIAPCDQPALSPEAILRLAAAHRSGGRTSAARYGGRNGAPAVFGRGSFGALAALSGDEGARRLLNSDPGMVSAVDLPELGADIDTPEDYAAWIRRTS